jgi:hypothetical protein
MLTVSVLMASITFSASRATPKKQCVSAQPNLRLVGMASKQECYDTDHSHSLVALCLVRDLGKAGPTFSKTFSKMSQLSPKLSPKLYA